MASSFVSGGPVSCSLSAAAALAPSVLKCNSWGSSKEIGSRRSRFCGKRGELSVSGATFEASISAESSKFSVSMTTDASKVADASKVSSAVEKLYDEFPFPPEPITDGPPPGYNFRWHYPTAYAIATGHAPADPNRPVNILDAGCGTGNCADFLAHLNPSCPITAIDLSSGALRVAQERWRRSGVGDRVKSHHLSLYDVASLGQKFDYINCVGVLHHLPDPVQGLRALADVLAPGGIMHIFVYAEFGRYEIRLMQEAISILQGDRRGDYRDGVAVGRKLFEALPKDNRLRVREETRWAMENKKDETFADMYVHPREVDYSIPTLFNWIDTAGLRFLGFSNGDIWNPERLFGSDPDLLARFNAIPTDEAGMRQRYRLIELLDPEAITHFEFFLGKDPLPSRPDLTSSPTLLSATPHLSACMYGWPSSNLLNYDWRMVDITPTQLSFLKLCADQSAQMPLQMMSMGGPLVEVVENPRPRRDVRTLMTEVPECTEDDVRKLAADGLIVLSF